MIKAILSLTLTTFILATLTGCSEEPPKPPSVDEVTAASVNEFGCKQEGVAAPKWTCIPMVDAHYAGVGIAAKSAAGMSHMRKVALANGRSDLAQQIVSQVKDKVEVFTSTTGNGAQETVDKVSTAVTKQLAQVDLQGSKGVDTWDAPSGTLYMLVTVPSTNVNKQVKNSLTSSFKSDNALWQQFKSKQALDALDAEFPSN